MPGEPGQPPSLAKFRCEKEFLLGEAVQEYDRNQINYVVALEAIGKEVCGVTHWNDPAGCEALLARDRLKKQRITI